MRLNLVTLSACLALAGCATPGGSLSSLEIERTSEEKSCVAWLASLDRVVEKAGTGDAEGMRISEFPHLRANRFLASFRDELDSPEKWAAWLQRLESLGRQRRNVELSNLPLSKLAELSKDRQTAVNRVKACGQLLVAADLISPMRLRVLRERTQIPDSYVSWFRAVGLYPLARIPFLSGVHEWQRSKTDAFSSANKLPADSPGWTAYQFEQGSSGNHTTTPPYVTAVLDALGIPIVEADQLDLLLKRYAPILNIETSGASDLFGRLGWVNSSGAGDQPRAEVIVETTSPTVYARQDFMRYGRQTLLQLTYTVWFPDRPAAHALDLLSGKLDGVMIRLTFGPDGRILLADSAHTCGCYHLFFPATSVKLRSEQDPREEQAFVPAGLPPMQVGGRLRFWLSAGTHYLVRVDTADQTTASGNFVLGAGEAALNVGGDGTWGASTRSLYRPDGLVSGTERGERFLFWPMGVISAGQMRQWGHHATAFVGRRHFDDANLIERYFSLSFEPVR